MFLGLDIGTSAVKAVILRADGRLMAEASSPLSVSRPRDNWSEQNPDDWWSAANAAVLAIDARLRAGVEAIGLAGQMHGAVLLDRQRRALRPAILWNDGRSATECVELLEIEPRTHAITGNLAMPGFTAPKLLWVQKREREIAAQTDLVLLPKDYVRLRMTGETATDVSDASGTLWVDVAARQWSEAMLAATRLKLRNMPRLLEGTEISGQLLEHVAQAWGMKAVPVAAGGGDNAAGAVGAGVVTDGAAMLSLGTSGVTFVATESHRPNISSAVHAFCHAIPGKWHQMSVMLSAASCLDWAARLLRFDDVSALIAEADGVETDVTFLPYLTGERTPHNDTEARGVFFGMTATTERRHLARAVLEGVALGLADGVIALRAAGTDPADISVIGGGARSAAWGGILASALKTTLIYRDGATAGPAFGAARLAQIAMGAPVTDVTKPPPEIARISPKTNMSKKQSRFRALYAALKPEFRR
jgi:xylulokinase